MIDSEPSSVFTGDRRQKRSERERAILRLSLRSNGRPYVPRYNPGGNYCGHDPKCLRQPAVEPKTGKGGIPPVLLKLIDRVTNYYYRPRKCLPRLDLANGSNRQQRTCRREACIILLQVFLAHTEIASLRVGMPTKDGFLNFTIPWLAKKTGMGEKRTRRALADLKLAGLVRVSQARILQPDGSWKGMAAVKTISRELFNAFGLAVSLKREQKQKSKKLKELAAIWSRENGTPTTLTQITRFRLVPTYEEPDIPFEPIRKREKKAPKEVERRRQEQMLALELREQYPNLTKEQIYELVKQRQGRFTA